MAYLIHKSKQGEKMNAEFYMEDIAEDDEITYSEEELEGMYKEYEKRVWEKFCFNKMLQQGLRI